MEIHRPVLDALLTAWHLTFSQNIHAEKVLERLFKANRRLGSRDRKFIAENFYDGIRWWRPIVEEVTGRWDDANKELFEDQYAKALECLLAAKSESRPWEAFAKKPRASAQSIPDWLDELGSAELGDKWEPTLKALNRTAPAYLRANGLKGTRDQLLNALAAEDIPAEAVETVPTAVKMLERKNVFQSAAYKAGKFEMQDAGSQLIAPFTKAGPKMRVIDACAGAGGKSLHLAELMKNRGRIVAMDIHEWKLKELRERASRAGADTIEVKVVEGSKDIKRYEGQADILLLDVPCSGLGVLRRHPDTKWKLTPADLEKTAQTQTEILEKYTSMLKSGGLLTYATCSILPSENSGRVQEFLAAHKNYELEEELNVSPVDTKFDGFYAARMKKS